MKKQDNKAAILLEILIIIFAITILVSSYGHTLRAVRLPIIVSAITLVLAIVDLIQIIHKNKSEEPKKIQELKTDAIDNQLTKRLIGMLIFMFLTLAFWRIIGYLFGSIVAIIGIGLFLGIKKRILLIIISVVISLLLYIIFGVLLGVPLPWGFLPMLF
jgi:divalent metal cation (Fe/Co/Zn/Cd) transporter